MYKKILCVLAILIFSAAIALAQSDTSMPIYMHKFISNYNQTIIQLPGLIRSVIGTETLIAHITLKNGEIVKIGIKTKDGMVTEVKETPFQDSTMNVYVSEKTIEDIIISDNPLKALQKAWGKEIRYEGIAIISKIKVFVADVGMKIFGLFL